MGDIIITHLSGTSANKEQRFSLDGPKELKLGRDPDCLIRFDPEKDDLVSRQHALIRIESLDPFSCTIRDLGSRNGTFVAGTRVDGAANLEPGVEIELGAHGPRIRFDITPRPEASGALAAPHTREAFAGASATGRTGDFPSRDGVGKSTVERMIWQINAALSESWRRRWLYSLTGVVLALALVAGVYAWLTADTRAKIQQAETNIAKTKTEILANTGEMNSKEIANRYQDAIVKINLTWRLYSRDTGRQVFHKHYDGHPAYVRLHNNQIVRWLVTDDERETNEPISGIGAGTGFVVNERGFILTNKHIAAGWQTFYELQSYEDKCKERAALNKDDDCAHLYEQGETKPKKNYKVITPAKSEYRETLHDWVPGYEGCLFDRDIPQVDRCADEQKTPEKTLFEGRNEFLEVRFPEKAASVQAQLVRTSHEVDLALIKINVPDDLKTKVDLAEKEFDPRVGADVTVIGYPTESEQTIAELYPIEAGRPRERKLEIPEPTVIGGKISNIGHGTRIRTGDYVSRTYATVGDVYQLAVGAMPGGSGGPVFDGRGKVIGIYTYGKGSNITFAVPIKYGHDLLELQSKWR